MTLTQKAKPGGRFFSTTFRRDDNCDPLAAGEPVNQL